MAKKSLSLTKDLLFYLKMDSLDGSNRLYDSVNGIWGAGASNGTQVVTGQISNGLSFVSDNFYIKNVTGLADFYLPALPNTGWTISGWLKLNSYSAPWFGNSDCGVFSDTSFKGLGFSYSSHKLFANANSGWCESSTTLSLNVWTHVVLRFDGSTMQIYQNGVQVASTSASFSTGFNFRQIANWSNYYQFNGLIDEVGVHGRAISDAEITKLYNSGIGITYPFTSSVSSMLSTGLTHYYNFDGNSVDIVGGVNGTDAHVNYPAAQINQGAELSQYSAAGIDLGSGFSLSSTFEISFWLKPKLAPFNQGAYSQWGEILGKDSANGLFVDQIGTSEGSPMYVELWAGNSLKISSVISAGNGYWINLSYDGTTARMYVNNIEVGSSSFSNTGHFDSIKAILSTDASQTNPLAAYIDELAIWNRVLSGGERTARYNGGTGLAHPF